MRGQLVKRWGELLTEHKEDLATLVTAEVGKITSEALGEVQEMIDITDLAVGQSRQLFGKTMPSERPGHRLMETWHPLGVVGIISAFNFPVAVYAWNTALALVAGDTVVWKPAEATLLSALATDALLARAAQEVGAPAGVHHLVLGDRVAGRRLVEDPRVALVSATGSVRMGREIAPLIAGRFGRALLELGGNNACDRHPERRSRPGSARDRLRRRRHRRTALHHPAPTDRAPFGSRPAGAADRRRVRHPRHRQPHRGRSAGRPADQPGQLRGPAGRPGARRRGGGRGAVRWRPGAGR